MTTMSSSSSAFLKPATIGLQAITMTGAPKLAQTFEALKDILEECNFMFTKQGIHVNSLDMNDMALINLTLWPHGFQRYLCNQNFVCGLNMVTLFKTFKVAGKQTQVTMQIMENDPEAVFVCLANPASGLRAEVTLRAFANTNKMLKIQDSVFNRFVAMPSVDFQSLINYISNFSSSGDDDNKVLTVEMFESAVHFSSEGQFGRTRVILQQTNTGMQVKKGDVDAMDDEFVKKGLENDDDGEDDNEGADNDEQDQENADDVDGDDDDDDDNESANPKSGAKKSRKRRRIVGRGSAAAAQAVVDAAEAAASASPLAQSSEKRLLCNHYNLKYVKFFTKATPLSATVRLFLRKRFAWLISYTIGTMGVLHFCLGPVSAGGAERIESDDDDDDEDEENQREQANQQDDTYDGDAE